MNYKDYKISRDLAWEILIRENITELPVKVSGLCGKMGIDVRLYNPCDGNGGKAIIQNGKPVIFINQNDSIPRQRFSAAHELGHILLGHVGKYRLVNREPSAKDNPIEQAANVFAARLVEPACVLKELNVRSAEDIMQICNVSYTAASIRYERLCELKKRGKFYTSDLERQAASQFSEYIKKNKF